jgi:hypothetical protein
MYTGPNTVNDGLVFGYDTGYGVADNNAATRFYPGEPTVNLLNYDTTMPTWPSNSSNMATLTSKTSARSFTVIGTCNVPGAMTFVYPSITTNTAFHTISATFTNNSTETSNVALYIRGKNNDSSTVSQSQTTTIQPGQSIRKTLIGNILTVNGGYTAAVGVWSHGTSGQVNMNVTDIQFEETTHATPFVDGTRSSTKSLIDLTRATDIDVSNVSFDSTGQPDYDGTDDHITGVLPMDGLGAAHTIEMIFSCNVNQGSLSGRKDPFSIGNSSIHQYSALDVNSSYMNWYFYGRDTNFTNSPLMVANKFYHIVLSYAGGASNNTNKKVWLNGVQQTLSAGSSEIPLLPNNPSFSVGRDRGRNTAYWPGEIPVWKVYQTAFTQEQALQNFNAYKNRFNI